jgi:hypothetical protein
MTDERRDSGKTVIGAKRLCLQIRDSCPEKFMVVDLSWRLVRFLYKERRLCSALQIPVPELIGTDGHYASPSLASLVSHWLRGSSLLAEVAPEIAAIANAPTQPSAQSASRTAQHLFLFLELLLPARITAEELSDGRELIHRLVNNQEHSLKVYVKTFSTSAWCLFNAFGYVIATVLGRNRNKS